MKRVAVRYFALFTLTLVDRATGYQWRQVRARCIVKMLVSISSFIRVSIYKHMLYFNCLQLLGGMFFY